jgi:hypothetical protein
MIAKEIPGTKIFLLISLEKSLRPVFPLKGFIPASTERMGK